MKKRIFTLLLAMVLVFGMIPVTARAATLSNGLEYEVFEDYVEIVGYTGDAGTVVIPSRIEGKPVTSIGILAFGECYDLTSVVIPDGVTSIGDLAFYECLYLSSIDIPDSLTSIGYYAFDYCGNLTSIDLPDNLAVIGEGAFEGCFNLSSVDIPDGIASIGAYTFAECSNLTSIDIPDSVTSIGESAFISCYNLRKIDIPDSVVSLGDCAFAWCEGLSSVTIPDGVTAIGNDVFYGCSRLTSITIPDSVKTIGESSFGWCERLGSIDIPDSVISIGKGAFDGCTNLTTIKIPDGVTSIADATFSYCTRLTCIELPRAVTSIGEDAFYNCERLASISIPGSVTWIGDSAFAFCENLSSIYFNGNAPVFGNDVFNYITTTAYYPAGNPTWTADVMQNYGGTITWVPDTSLRTELRITQQPVSVTVGEGKTAKVTVTATGDGLTYQWYYKNAGASKFTLTNSFKSNTYSVTMDDSRNGRQVYCVITDKYGNSVQTDIVTLKMATLTITKQSGNVTVAKGQAAKAYVNVKGEGLTFKWYYKNAGDSKFYLTNSFKSNTYSVAMDASRNGRQVYCVITDKYGNTVKTDPVTLKMATLTITKQSGNVTVAKGQTATAYVNVSGEGLTFKWYYKNAGDTKFTLTNSFKSNVYSVAMDASRNGRQVYCVITDKYGNTVKTDPVTLKMATLTITKQSGNVTVAKGQTATAYVNVKGEGLTFKWYYKNAGDSKFYLTNSFKSNVYSVAMDASRNGRQVYCVISDKYGNTVTSNIVSLKMK